jgi:hypothetical protein
MADQQCADVRRLKDVQQQRQLHLLLLNHSGKKEMPTCSTAKTSMILFRRTRGLAPPSTSLLATAFLLAEKAAVSKTAPRFRLVVAGLTAKSGSCGRGRSPRFSRRLRPAQLGPAVKIFHPQYAKICIDIKCFRDYSSHVLPDLLCLVFFETYGIAF